MKVFRELILTGSPTQLTLFIQCVTEHTNRSTSGWHRNANLEAQLTSRSNTRAYCFTCNTSDSRHSANLWLAVKDAGQLYVSNIVPIDVQELGYDAYNDIITEFYRDFAAPCAQLTATTIEFTGQEAKLETWLSTNTAKLLLSFSRLANHATGSSHPLDQARWFDFIIAAHNENSPLPPSLLERFLHEEEGWTTEKAADLAIEYSTAQSLLKAYDKRRGNG